VAILLVGAILGFCYSSYMVDPVYQSKSMFFVDTGALNENSINNNKVVEQHNVTVYSRQVVASYIGIIDTLNFTETLYENLFGEDGFTEEDGLSREYSPRSLLGSINYNNEEDLEIFTVRVLAISNTRSTMITGLSIDIPFLFSILSIPFYKFRL
jgi:capsular polysaccharide biosynthesis protein